jgi:hypothetical protein
MIRSSIKNIWALSTMDVPAPGTASHCPGWQPAPYPRAAMDDACRTAKSQATAPRPPLLPTPWMEGNRSLLELMRGQLWRSERKQSLQVTVGWEDEGGKFLYWPHMNSEDIVQLSSWSEGKQTEFNTRAAPGGDIISVCPCHDPFQSSGRECLIFPC